MRADGYLRIGELSRRVGVPADVIRAWERRYGLLRPARSAGGYRLYADDDERRIQRMKEHLARGISAAEAARLALADDAQLGETPSDASRLDSEADQLREALDALDEARAHAALDRLLAAFTVETVVRDVVLPYLSELGERWRRGTASIAQEHFASNVLRGRLLGLARGWGEGAGPRALLACAPGEQHDIGLIAFGLALHARGWRITFLGSDTPVPMVGEAARLLDARFVVVAATDANLLQAELDELTALSSATPLHLAGAGATAEIAARAGAVVLEGGPFGAAERVAAWTRA